MPNEIVAFMDALGLGKARVFGYSMDAETGRQLDSPSTQGQPAEKNGFVKWARRGVNFAPSSYLMRAEVGPGLTLV